ncbi:MAG: transposase [Methanomethylovorans sp.]|uniref:transposase n=1 Tax=Methanomethylovorans sp. TaxID=2758717 RepID=UPI003C796C9A
MEFRELSDDQWKFIKPHLPPQPITGRKRADDRKVINGILFVLITGCRWGDMPDVYGSQATAWRRLKRWSEEGIWNKIMESLRNSAYQKGKFSFDTVCIDSSFIETKKGERTLRIMVTRKEEA